LQPDEGNDEMQHHHKPPREFLIARRQPSKLLETVKKALNQIPVFVNMIIVFSRNNTVFSARNNCLSATCQKQTDGIAQSIHRSMNFCRQPTMRASDVLQSFFFWTPVEC
jgi:hypothetical protein